MTRRAEGTGRTLWLTGQLGWPAHAGDLLYSQALIAAAASRGPVHVVGRARDADTGPPAGTGGAHVDWSILPPARRGRLASLATRMPSQSHQLIGADYVAACLEVLRAPGCDVVRVVLDQAAPLAALRAIRAARPDLPLFYAAHNVEAQTRAQAARHAAPSPLLRAPMMLDAAKHALQERAMLRHAAGVTAISAEDAATFAARGARNVHVAPALHAGPRHPGPRAMAGLPREVLLIGSFDWVSKQENLRRFATAAAGPFARAGIVLRVVGSVPDPLRTELMRAGPAIRLEGRVADPEPLLRRARIGAVPEMLGSGFKLKLLDYAFNRIAIAGVRAGMAGFAAAEGAGWLGARDPDDLVRAIVAAIDDDALLARLQATAHAAVEARHAPEALAEAIAACFAAGR